jgi:hypothetical protein
MMTLAELEIEIVKRGVVVSSVVRYGGKWCLFVHAQDGVYGAGADDDLEAAVRQALAEYDAKRAASFCVGEA